MTWFSIHNQRFILASAADPRSCFGVNPTLNLASIGTVTSWRSPFYSWRHFVSPTCYSRRILYFFPSDVKVSGSAPYHTPTLALGILTIFCLPITTSKCASPGSLTATGLFRVLVSLMPAQVVRKEFWDGLPCRGKSSAFPKYFSQHIYNVSNSTDQMND